MLTPLNQQQGQPSMHGIGAQMAAQGRGPDSTLVHMAPSEVAGLNALARSTVGQGLTINPTTGLPEAGILSSILPMVLGAVLSPFITPIGAAAVVGAGAGLMEHSLTKGLMAGLSAFGGAGIGGALSGMMSGASSAAGLGSAAADAGAIGGGAASGIAGDISATMAPAAEGIAGAGAGASASDLALNSIAQGAASAVPGAVAPVGASADMLGAFGQAPEVAGAAAPAAGSATQIAAQHELEQAAAQRMAATMAQNAPTGILGGARGALSSFGDTLQAGGSHTLPGMSKALPGLAGIVPRSITTAAGMAGVMSGLSGAMTPDPLKVPTAENKYPYMGPYKAVPRTLNTPPASRFNDQGIPTDSSEFNWFSSSQPDLPYAYETQAGGPPPGYPGYVPPTPEQLKAMGYAKGGIVSLKPGGFVMDARSVSELGNGSSSAGKELLRKHGGEPIDGGKGDGVSDDIPAKIKGGPQARVARDEVKFSPKAVRKMGGPQKLYALVDAAHRARASAGRGQDTGLRRALA